MEIPDEPIEIKKRIIGHKDEWISTYKEIWGSETIGRGTTDWKVLIVWVGNRIQSYLWGAWKDVLKKEGFTWQRFLKMMRYRTDDALLWIQSKITWDEFVKRITESVEGDLGKRIAKE